VLNRKARQIRAEFERNEAVCGRVLGLFHLVAHKPRFRIVCLLCRGEFCVNDIAEVVGGRISNISQQLKMLTLGGLITRRRDQQRILYTVADERVRHLVEFLRAEFLNDP
jgi:ArsR family transcriptional regulator, lead/cadmium/zinc/bismuth-responsive transcriptional repressor